MKFFLKNVGIFLVFIGALILILPFFIHFQTNRSLLTGWLMIITGFISYIFINKKIP
jgi:drug/metabolite transporter (DMT)-like permease